MTYVNPNYYSTTINTTTSVPYKCPVCKGRGTVKADFYPAEDTRARKLVGKRVECVSCTGKGVIYVYSYNYPYTWTTTTTTPNGIGGPAVSDPNRFTMTESK